LRERNRGEAAITTFFQLHPTYVFVREGEKQLYP
jgi:hypothetical protein